MEDLDADRQRLIPVNRQKSFELALQDAEARLHDPALLKLAQRRLAHLGGAAQKSDALQGVIMEEVEKDPTIRRRELEQYLRSLQGQGGVVDDIDEEKIYGPASISASISGLKDRLSRAKKALKSR